MVIVINENTPLKNIAVNKFVLIKYRHIVANTYEQSPKTIALIPNNPPQEKSNSKPIKAPKIIAINLFSKRQIHTNDEIIGNDLVSQKLINRLGVCPSAYRKYTSRV